MSRRLTSLLAATTLVAGLAVGVTPARALAPAPRATTVSSTAQSHELVALLGQLHREVKLVTSRTQSAPGDLPSPTGLLAQLESLILGLLNSLTSALGLPPLPGLPVGGAARPARDPDSITGVLGQVQGHSLGLLNTLGTSLGLAPMPGLPAPTPPTSVPNPLGLLSQLEGLVLALLNSLTSALGLPSLPGLPVGGVPGTPAAPLETQLVHTIAQAPSADLGSPLGLLTQLEALVLGLLNSITAALGLPPLPGLPGLPPVSTPGS